MRTGNVAKKHRPALVLNADYRPLSYQPLSLLPWQETVSAVFKDKVTVVAEYDEEVHSPSITMRIPSVIALKEYAPVKKHIPFTRFNVYLRDRFRCQYCGEKFTAEDLTFDHVKPQADGGLTNWDNIVTACFECNNLKDNKYKKPLMDPRKPTISELLLAQREFPPTYLHESWLDYLYWDSEIEPK